MYRYQSHASKAAAKREAGLARKLDEMDRLVTREQSERVAKARKEAADREALHAELARVTAERDSLAARLGAKAPKKSNDSPAKPADQETASDANRIR